MQLQNDTIRLEGKTDIDKMLNMIDAYLASHPDGDKTEIEQLKRDLDQLWYNW